jgi:hypothetical protein
LKFARERTTSQLKCPPLLVDSTLDDTTRRILTSLFSQISALETYMSLRNVLFGVMAAVLISWYGSGVADAAPLLAVEFGSPLANSELQPGFQGIFSIVNLVTLPL